MKSHSPDLGFLIENAARRFEEAGLSFGHGTSSAFDDAAFLALETLGLPVDSLEENWERPVIAAEAGRLEEVFTERIRTRKPSAYIVNKAYIQGIPFYVDERVITPRSFIAEILCQEDGFSRVGDYEEIDNVLDLCTGSGCLAVLAAHLFPNARIDAADLSAEALEVARRNVAESGFSGRIDLHQGDLFAPLAGKKYGLIITNPPYVDAAAMGTLPEEHRREPAMALAGGADGLDIVHRIIAGAGAHLDPEGGLLCEVGRGKDLLEEAYPRTPFVWLDTEESEGEVFWIPARDLPGKK